MSLYIIVGGSETGVEIAKLLLGEGHDVVIVEKEKSVAEKISTSVDCLVILGDATNLATLMDAKIEKARGIAILTEDDNTNLMVTQFAKKLNVKEIVVRVNDPTKRDFFNQLNVTAVISPSSVIARAVRNALVEGSEKTLLILGNGKLELMEIHVPDELVGKQIKELGLHEDTRVICIYRKGDVIIAHENTTLENGDTVVIVAKVDVVKEVLKIFRTDEIKKL